jgi:leucyl aminopeptidase
MIAFRRFVLISTASLAFTPSLAARTIQFASQGAPADGALVLPVAQGKPLSGVALQVSQLTGGALERAIKSASFEGKKKSSLNLYGLGSFNRVTLIGVGDKPLTRADLEEYGGQVATLLREDKAADVKVVVPAADATSAAQTAVGADLGFYSFDSYRDKKQASKGTLTLLTADPATAKNAWEKDWQSLTFGVRFTRDLVSEPSNIKTPQWIVTQAQKAFAGVPNVTLEVMDVPAMQKQNMGLIVGVGQGSVRPPRMLIVRYTGHGTAAPVVITGKGITFDSGGISLKDPAGMWRMRYDMAGAAAALGTVLAQARRGAKNNVIAIAALAENMPGNDAIRPGDVLTAMNGKTVEVINTDAEGRLVLGDASWLGSTRFAPAAQISIATLTGSARATFGADFAALLTDDDTLRAGLTAAGKISGEKVWELPMTGTQAEEIKSDVADYKNSSEGGYAGASFGAKFIQSFVKPGTPWAHLDIAGVAWADKETPSVPKGAAGWGVRLLDSYLRGLE